MIFSRFLTPDHAKSDPKVRRAAIDKLSPDDPKNRQILHELAFNDEDVDVNLTALDKLNSFALWQKTATTAVHQRVKKQASKRVKDAILSNTALPEKERKQFILESADSALLDDVIRAGGPLFEDVEFTFKIIEKSAKPSVTDLIFVKHGTAQIRSRLVEQETDMAVLSKWLKKAPEQSTKDRITAKIASLERLKNRPAQLLSEIRMVLAKLLALTENTDYVKFVEARENLETHYTNLSAEFSLLKDRERSQFDLKKANIKNKLDYHQGVLKERYSKAQAEAEKQLKLSELNKQLADQVDAVAHLFMHIETATLAALETTQQDIQTLSDQVEKNVTIIGRQHCEPLLNKINELTVKLTKIPEWQRQTKACNEVLATLATEVSSLVSNPQDIADSLTTLEAKFYQVYETASPVADAQLNTWRELKLRLKQAQREYNQQRNQAINETRKSLSLIASLIAKGKYKIALNKFAAFNAKWGLQPDTVTTTLASKYQSVLAQIERLEGWQHYLAAPRKPQLVEQAQTLLNDTQMSMVKRAEQIKVLRRQWQSLSFGNQQDIDLNAEQQAQNSLFDSLLEQAFIPCRLYFAEQQEKRQQALSQRQTIISEMQTLIEQSLEPAALLKQYDTLLKQWRDAATALPQQDYIKLKAQFDDAKAQVKLRLEPYFVANNTAKADLITKLTNLVQQPVTKEATEQAKQWQQQWKLIGSAGERIDRKLWVTFRELNDKLFAQAKQLSDARKTEVEAAILAVNAMVDELAKCSSELQDDEFKQRIATIEVDLKSLPTGVTKGIRNTISEIEQQRNRFVVQQNTALRVEQVDILMNLLASLASEAHFELSSVPSWQNLPKTWRQALNNKDKLARHFTEQLIITEAVLGLPTPQSEQEMKTTLQLQLLNDSFNNSHSTTAHQEVLRLLTAFVECPSIDKLERVRACLIKSHVELSS